MICGRNIINIFQSSTGLENTICGPEAIFVQQLVMSARKLFKLISKIKARWLSHSTLKGWNLSATTSGIWLSIFQDYVLNGSFNGNILERVWNLIVLVGFVILLYVLVGFRLFSRIDSLFDKKIGEDKDDDDKYFPEKKRKINNRGKNDKNN